METQAASATRHVLLVDDNADICQALAMLLGAAGMSATCVIGGAAALAWLGESTPDLILLDLMMPDIDGLEILRRVRSDPRTAAVPVVVFSATSEAEGRERAMRAGATDYWVKDGLDFATLRRRLAEHLGG